jgi:hypothetical protein
VSTDLTVQTTWAREHKFEVTEGLPVAEYLFGDPMLWGDGSNNSIGGRALIPHKGNLNEEVKLWDGEARNLLLLRDTVLGAESTTSPNIDLRLRRRLFAIILGEKLVVDVTEKQKRGRWQRRRVL